jgi:hypothetical protein
MYVKPGAGYYQNNVSWDMLHLGVGVGTHL